MVDARTTRAYFIGPLSIGLSNRGVKNLFKKFQKSSNKITSRKN